MVVKARTHDLPSAPSTVRKQLLITTLILLSIQKPSDFIEYTPPSYSNCGISLTMAQSTEVSDSAIVKRDNATATRASKLPAPMRFPLLVVLSLSLSGLLYSFVAEYTTGELASVSRSLNEWWEVGALVGWKAFELGLGWFGGYDSYDLAALTLLSHGPPVSHDLACKSSRYNFTSRIADGLSSFIY